MADEQIYLGREEVGTDGYLGPSKFRVRCRCLRCSREYTYTTKKLSEEDRPCPRKKCREAARSEQVQREAENMAQIIAEGRAPGHVGSTGVRLIDKTAEIVMHDHGLTNLKDNIRQGEMMAPRLPYRQQQAADNFFQGPPKGNQAQARRFKQLGAMALRGAFAGNAINPAAVLPGKRGEAVLRKIGTEKLRG